MAALPEEIFATETVWGRAETTAGSTVDVSRVDEVGSSGLDLLA
jgi:hypothetical protein